MPLANMATSGCEKTVSCCSFNRLIRANGNSSFLLASSSMTASRPCASTLSLCS